MRHSAKTTLHQPQLCFRVTIALLLQVVTEREQIQADHKPLMYDVKRRAEIFLS